MKTKSLGFRSMKDYDVKGKRVLIRVDINSPIDPQTKRIVNENRINKTLPTLEWLMRSGAKVAIIAHQGDTLDYHNLMPLAEHAEKLTEKLGMKVRYIDDVCGPMAQSAVEVLDDGEAVLLGNLRYLCEEISTFEDAVKLRPEEMLNTWLVRSLAPLFDLYVNDAFAAAHRNAPSMVAFQELLPSAAGPLFFNEVSTLSMILNGPETPSVFVLGGAKISDAFGMMEQVLSNGTADKILTCGVTGEVFLIASGLSLGAKVDAFLDDKGLRRFVDQAAGLLDRYGDKILMPSDLAYAKDGAREEMKIADAPIDELFLDIGTQTINTYVSEIEHAGTIFVNGPAGVYEDAVFENGTRDIWQAMAKAPGFTVVGGGDSVTATSRFCDPSDMNYICTAGGAMVRFLSGKKLPLIAAMEKAGARETMNP